MLTVDAWVTVDGIRIEKTFSSKSYRGVRWMAMRWIKKNREWGGWGYTFNPI